jgi:preprotein translocase subunit YajC
MHVYTLIAQTPPSQPPAWSPLIMMGGILLIFYFIVMRPQLKQRKEHQAMVKAVKKNDSIVTLGGLHGTIAHVKESTVVVRVDDNTKVEIDRDALARVVPRGGNA